MRRLVICLLWLMCSGAALATATDVVAEYDLGEGVVARLDMAGGLTLGVAVGEAWTPLLSGHWDLDTAILPGEVDLFTALSREGDPAGRRGFARSADDDGDGRTNEDPRDGRDNDGDGAIDEDFAAISHAMAIWDAGRGQRFRHLETYHWSYPNLASLLVAAYRTENLDHEALTWSLPAGRWQRADEVCRLPEILATGPVYLVSLPHPGTLGQTLWLGIALLDATPRALSHQRVRQEDQTLSVPLLEGAQALALAVAPTRLRAIHDLADAGRLRQGIEDPVSGQRVRWLPPAVPTEIPAETLPSARLERHASGDADLTLSLGDDTFRRFDPDLFLIDDTPLGSPEALVWQPFGADMVELAWPTDADGCLPYTALGVAGSGDLVFRFSGLAEIVGDQLEAVAVDGRHAVLGLTVTSTDPVEETEIEADSLADPESPLQLSADLLTNYPNPFRSHTRISYQIPATVGEAFASENGDLGGLDPQMAMPYSSSLPSVQVNIYSLEGREVASLFVGSLGIGSYEVQWDGRDRTGRTMASGAYFCKLQIENWSVTKRLIFIR
jgi:hypothetical protein